MTRTRTWDPMINSHLLYRLSYHGTTYFKVTAVLLPLRPCPYRYVSVSEARYSTILKPPVNPLNCF
ncbi:hypothetical protein METHPM2_20124 [Pseudomonas sp. PM2]